MKNQENIDKIAKLTERIAELPRGYISKKQVGGQVYFYHQWSENGTKNSKYLKDDEVKALAEKIEERRHLQQQVRELKSKNVQSAGHLICTLMHKSIPVAKLELDSESGHILKILKLYAKEHLPVGVAVKNGAADKGSLNDWWTDRSIPASRSGVRDALENLHIASTKALLVRCYGLSLSDQYWICPENSDLSWEKINFFQNNFSEDIGDVLFGAGKKGSALNFSSPDSTSDGN